VEDQRDIRPERELDIQGTEMIPEEVAMIEAATTPPEVETEVVTEGTRGPKEPKEVETEDMIEKIDLKEVVIDLKEVTDLEAELIDMTEMETEMELDFDQYVLTKAYY